MPSTLTSQAEAVGDALITFLSSRLTSLGLVSFDWADHMRDQPVRPCNPRTECPRGFLTLVQLAHNEAEQIGCSSARFVYQFSIWIQLRQTPGQEHQRLMVQALDLVATALLQENFNLTNELGISELLNVKVEPADGLPFTELDHPLEDPQLRVSVGESAWTLSGEIRE